MWHITERWAELKNAVSNNDKNATVKMQQFRYENNKTKEGENANG